MAGPEADHKTGALAARARALAVLRIRSTALAVALLPTAAAVVLLAGSATGRIGGGDGWTALRWAVVGVALVVLLVAAGIAAVVVRARPALSPTVPIPEETAPDLYRLVRDLADRLDVPAPSAIALTPDCDSWLEDRTHRAHGAERQDPARQHPARQDAAAVTGRPGGRRERRQPSAPVLVIGSPFLWWMRVEELRALLAPVVAGTGPSAHPDIAAARRFVRGLDAAVAVAARGTRPPGDPFGRPQAPSDLPPAATGPAPGPDALPPGAGPGRSRSPWGRSLFDRAVRRPALGCVGWVARLLLRGCREHAAEMERGVATAASQRAQDVDYGLRIVAQEQVGLAYAGWDRLLTRVALPAWRMGRWPSRLDAGVVSALTELSRRDRLAEGFASRLGERPACDLLEEPGLIDEATSLLAARLFHGGPPTAGPDWVPIGWDEYPDEVVDRTWRLEAARLLRVLDELPRTEPRPEPGHPAPGAPELRAEGRSRGPAERHRGPAETRPETRTRGRGTARPEAPSRRTTEFPAEAPAVARAAGGRPAALRTPFLGAGAARASRDAGPAAADSPGGHPGQDAVPTLARVIDRLSATGPGAGTPVEELAALLTGELAREEAAAWREASRASTDADSGTTQGSGGFGDGGPGEPLGPGAFGPGEGAELWTDGFAPLFPLQPPRTGRELLADHVTAMVCCAALDTADAAPGLDWLDGPVLLIGGRRAADLAVPVLSLVEDGDAEPLRAWLGDTGVRSERPVRLG